MRSLVDGSLMPSPWVIVTLKPSSGKTQLLIFSESAGTISSKFEFRSTIASMSRDDNSLSGVVRNATHQQSITWEEKPPAIIISRHLGKRLKPYLSSRSRNKSSSSNLAIRFSLESLQNRPNAFSNCQTSWLWKGFRGKSSSFLQNEWTRLTTFITWSWEDHEDTMSATVPAASTFVWKILRICVVTLIDNPLPRILPK